MKVSRPHIIARKSILPAFKFRRIFFFLVFAALAAVIALMGNDIVASVEILNPIASFLPIIAAVFAVLAVIPLMGIIIRIIILRHIYVEFYDTYVIKRRGVFNKTEEKCMFPKILSVNVYRSFWGRIFGYGNISIDAIGKWDVDLTNIKKPKYIRKYLETHFISAKEIRSMRQTVVTQ